MVIFKDGLHETLDEAGVLALMAQSSEFEALQVCDVCHVCVCDMLLQ